MSSVSDLDFGAPPDSSLSPPNLTAAQMALVDRIMIEHHRIGLLQMMENAGRALARLARLRFLGGDARDKRVTALVGGGGNGGGVLVATRHLYNWGARVEVVLGQAMHEMKPTPKRQLDAVKRMGIAITRSCANRRLDRDVLVLDGLIGYSLRGAPSGPVANLIRWANGSGASILALDAPSGVDVTTGVAFDPAIRADATLTLALPKTGLREAGAADHVGALYLADIGVPPSLYLRPEFNFDVAALFAREEIVRLR